MAGGGNAAGLFFWNDMTTAHASIQDAECHEPKHITSSLVTDAGKVLTPSGTVAGTSELRLLASTELSDTANLARKDGSNGPIKKRITNLTYAASVASSCDTTDIGTLTLAGAVAFAAPTGTPVDGQSLVYRIVSDGVSAVTWASIFRFAGATAPTITLTSGKTDRVAFEYNQASAKWDCVALTQNL